MTSVHSATVKTGEAFTLVLGGPTSFGVQATKETPISAIGRYRTFMWKFKVLLIQLHCPPVKGKPLCHPLDSVSGELCGSVRTSGVGLTALPPRTVRSPSSNSAVSQESPRVIKGNVFCSSLNHESELLISIRFWKKWHYHRK